MLTEEQFKAAMIRIRDEYKHHQGDMNKNIRYQENLGWAVGLNDSLALLTGKPYIACDAWLNGKGNPDLLLNYQEGTSLVQLY